MTLLPALHVLCAGLWLGCIAVESVFEHTMPNDADTRLRIARLHWRVDLAVEVPAFAATALTGALLYLRQSADPWLTTKAVLGCVAVLLNLYCVWIVRRRLGCAIADDESGYEAIDRLQHRVGGLLALVLAAVIALAFWRVAG